MTSASELFYPRRSRVGRTSSDIDLNNPSESERGFLTNYNRRHHRRDLDGCDLRRINHSRHPSNRSSLLNDRASLYFDEDISASVASTSVGAESFSSPRTVGHERLPVAVQHARERLLERLRGVSLSANRQTGRPAIGTYNGENRLGNDLRLAGSGDRDSDISPGWRSSSSVPNMTIENRRFGSYKNRPPGLTTKDLDCLQLEVFSCQENGAEGELVQVSYDCSICLESFKEGDRLIRLPCEHRFHSACLDPWVRTCGDCPYCRRDIPISSWSLKTA